ncbi:hypothetical protein BIV25_38750 [Streptomyces sp. MUSC 14]|nr:hypothetical protein BIV25_38750 [Streptomyces sp. MUSC 14]
MVGWAGYGSCASRTWFCYLVCPPVGTPILWVRASPTPDQREVLPHRTAAALVQAGEEAPGWGSAEAGLTEFDYFRPEMRHPLVRIQLKPPRSRRSGHTDDSSL